MPALVAGIRGARVVACTEAVPIEGETQMTRSEIVAAVAAEAEIHGLRSDRLALRREVGLLRAEVDRLSR